MRLSNCIPHLQLNNMKAVLILALLVVFAAAKPQSPQSYGAAGGAGENLRAGAISSVSGRTSSAVAGSSASRGAVSAVSSSRVIRELKKI
ncbi:hypothetical protein O3G_MSEX003209 [Manduca sexta]|uniref:Uncharacterized protein n=1 Tax=Manduca sexta TaxID=7130 RepID=A0A921YS34_MANSE|nr:hypothetical protein O3G_MSEX003209 [Manduca sexta]